MHDPEQLLDATTQIIVAAIAAHPGPLGDIPSAIKLTYAALAETAESAPIAKAPPEPAVPIRSSVKHDHIVCLEDGAKLKMLKRYLRGRYGMSPEQYRAKWGLPASYPMVAPGYSEVRKDLAIRTGLGRKRAA